MNVKYDNDDEFLASLYPYDEMLADRLEPPTPDEHDTPPDPEMACACGANAWTLRYDGELNAVLHCDACGNQERIR